MTRAKRLAGIDKADVQARSAAGEGLTLAEAAVRYGVGYATMKRLIKQGLRLRGGKGFHVDWLKWRPPAIKVPTPRSIAPWRDATLLTGRKLAKEMFMDYSWVTALKLAGYKFEAGTRTSTKHLNSPSIAKRNIARNRTPSTNQ
jgi:hypothetical protein